MIRDTGDEVFIFSDSNNWRNWLERNHREKTEAWLAISRKSGDGKYIRYLDAVEEALCFGWIDGVAGKFNEFAIRQRFTPRKKKSSWTELNKERVRRLIRLNRMTPAGLEVLPDLSISSFHVPDDILALINSEPDLKNNFENFPELYLRVRIGYIIEVRKNKVEYNKRLDNFLRNTRQNKLFGNWNDEGRLID